MPRRPLRVAVDARSLLCAQPRGEGKSLLRLYQEIARLRPEIEVLLFGDERADRYGGPLPSGARLVRQPMLTSRLELWDDLLFPLRAHTLGCTLMHCASSGAPRLAGMPMIMTVHDLIPLVFDDGHSEAARQRFAMRLKAGLRQAGVVLTVSGHTRRDLQERFPGRARRVEVAHWGGEHTKDAVHTAPPPTVVLFGGEARRKNTDYSLDRFIAAARRVPQLRLALIGVTSPHQRSQLTARLQSAGLMDRVHMPGFIAEDELARTLSGATALLYLSLYEGFGLPLLEGIGQGLPVIASNQTSLPEILGTAPGLFSLDQPAAIEDALVLLATNAAARLQFAAQQQAVLPHFDWSATAAHYISAMESTAWV